MKKEYSIEELYWLLQSASAFLVQDGFKFKESNGPVKNPKDPADAAYLVAIALAEHGNNENLVAVNKKSNATNYLNGIETDDWGLWQINDGKEILQYLTSTSEHTNSNISIFKNKSRAELKKMMLNPFYNAIAAIAIAQLQSDDKGNKFSSIFQGVNNWSTVQQNKVDTTMPLQLISETYAAMDVQSKIIDKHLEYWDDIFQTEIRNIKPANEINIEPPAEVEDITFTSKVNDLLQKATTMWNNANQNKQDKKPSLFSNIVERSKYGDFR